MKHLSLLTSAATWALALGCVAASWSGVLPNGVTKDRYARFAAGSGNPPWSTPEWLAANAQILSIIQVQNARAESISHWLRQTEYPLTYDQRVCLTNSLAEVIGHRNDSMQFAGPVWCSVGPWPR